MRLENERLCVEITELGAEILRVYDKKYGREVVWEADPAYWKRQDRKSTRLNSSHPNPSRMPSSA